VDVRRVALASCVCVVLGCSATRGSEPLPVSGGASSAETPGSGGSGAGSTAGGAAGGEPDPTSAGSAGQGSAAGGAEPEAGAAGVDASDPLNVRLVLDTYRSYAPQTPAPVNVSGYIFGLCRLPTLRETEFEASIHGDGRYLRDWANDVAVQGIATRGEPKFPVGSVIVKEKYAGPQAEQADLVAIALMIKRQAGFDPAHGDWDYAYYEPSLGVVQTTEQTAYCGQCHAAASASDFVFVDGLKP
jgi:Cytochrome P460